MKKYFYLLILFFISACHSSGERANFCYIPMGIETYIPVTIEDIDAKCMRNGTLGVGDLRCIEIISIIKRAEKGEFEKDSVRLKIFLDGGEIIYFDNYGGIKSEAGEFKMRKNDIFIFKSILNNVTSEISMKKRGE